LIVKAKRRIIEMQMGTREPVMEISFQTVMSQVMLGLNNGVFYAILSLGLAVIFGLLNIVNFAHGALYMLGAYVALLGYTSIGPLIGMPDFHLNYWAALIVAPLVVGVPC
jgi:branched-chain amino acid transport system permease protein